MISRIYSWLALSFAVITSLATSSLSHQRTFAEGEYRVKSDCPNAQSEGLLRIEVGDLNFEGSYNLLTGTDFGFPSNTLLEGRVTHPDRGATTSSSDGERVCKAMLWDTQADSGLFICHRGDNLECTIHLERN